MEAFLHGGLRLFVHIGILFNLFVKYCCVPLNFMSSVIVPLVKCNTKDICNYIKKTFQIMTVCRAI